MRTLTRIAVRYGWYIDALDVVYTLSNGEPRSTGHGGWGDNTNIQNWSYNFGSKNIVSPGSCLLWFL